MAAREVLEMKKILEEGAGSRESRLRIIMALGVAINADLTLSAEGISTPELVNETVILNDNETEPYRKLLNYLTDNLSFMNNRRIIGLMNLAKELGFICPYENEHQVPRVKEGPRNVTSYEATMFRNQSRDDFRRS